MMPHDDAIPRLAPLVISFTSLASVLVEDKFLRTGQTESLVAPLTQFGGVTTRPEMGWTRRSYFVWRGSR